MPRRERIQDQEFHHATEKVKRLLGTPLDQIGLKLREFLQIAHQSFLDNGLDRDAFTAISTSIADMVDRLPASFGQRFHFDSALIQGIAEDWGTTLRLSRMIVPIHSGAWGHTRIPMPSEDMLSAHVVDLIHMPGRDDLREVDLLDYPWIVHELGHYILLQHDSQFIGPFEQELQQTVSKLRLSSIADRGTARAAAQAKLDEIAKFWSPTRGQKNWAHEITIDLLSLLFCGPAYLASFCDVVESPDLNPFEITESHPPYATRADALIALAKQIGLGHFTNHLQALHQKWHSGQWKNRRDNRFLALARPELSDCCAKLALSLCDSLQITICTPSKLDEIAAKAKNNNSEEIGIDLLLCAWSVYDTRGKDAYLDWEQNVLQQLVRAVTQ